MRQIATLTTLIAACLAVPSNALASGDWTWPVAGQVVTEFHNGSDPYAAGQHRGVDIAAPSGARVVAATPGTVTYAGVVGTSGLTVAERTADGRYVVSYLHLSSVAVRRGQAIGQGDSLGAVGTTGKRSVEAPHLHLGVREADDEHAYIDPLRFLTVPPAQPEPPSAAPVPVAAPVPAAPAPAPAAAAVSSQVPQPAHGAAPTPAGSPATAPGHVLGPHAPFASSGAAQTSAHGSSLPATVPRATWIGDAAAQAARPALDASVAHSVHAQPGAPRADGEQRRGTSGATAPQGASGGAESETSPVTDRSEAAARDADAAPASGHHVNLGWLAACVGLVAAAALLAGPGTGPRRNRTSARRVFATLLRAGSRG
jgi:hypothetical protein